MSDLNVGSTMPPRVVPPDFEATLDELSFIRELTREGQVFHRYLKRMVDHARFLRESVLDLDLSDPERVKQAIQFKQRAEAIDWMVRDWQMAFEMAEQMEMADENA